MTIAQLSALDAGFLYAESASTPMHIGAVQVFDVPPARRADFFTALQHQYAQRLGRVPFLTRRLVPMQFGVDHPVWETVQVDIERHFGRARLPVPGTMAQLEALIAELHATPLDRARPLWHYTVIEGLEGGRLALYTKFHHAALDGVAGQALLELMYDATPDCEIPNAVAASELAEPIDEVHSSPVERSLHALLEFADDARHSRTRALDSFQAFRKLGSHVARGHSLGAYTRAAPLTRFNVTVGRARSFAVGTLPMPAVRALARQEHATINDVFLAVCATALREHLLALRSLPPTALIAGVPVSLRGSGDDRAAMSNRVGMMLCSLATEVAEPLERLRAIAASAKAGKQVAALTRTLSEGDVHLPGLPNLLGAFAALPAFLPIGTPVPSPTNIVISNVPGPRQPKYLLGARMLTHYPVSIPAHGGAVNITVQSYQDRLDFAVTGCRVALPDAGKLRDRVLAAWALYSAMLPASVEPPTSAESDAPAEAKVRVAA